MPKSHGTPFLSCAEASCREAAEGKQRSSRRRAKGTARAKGIARYAFHAATYFDVKVVDAVARLPLNLFHKGGDGLRLREPLKLAIRGRDLARGQRRRGQRA